MDREQTARAAKVMQAFADGKPIQFRGKGSAETNWQDVLNGDPSWDWICNLYRVKPEPVTVTRWAIMTKAGLYLNSFGCEDTARNEVPAGGYVVKLTGTYEAQEQ